MLAMIGGMPEGIDLRDVSLDVAVVVAAVNVGVQ